MKECIVCGSQLKHGVMFCCRECKNKHDHNNRVNLWLEGKHDGVKGKTSTCAWIKRHMINVNGEKCMECGWGERNPHTGKIPIELEHIDGDFMNNHIDNLKLLCPNCHSLTSTYKGANKKAGRPRAKYYRGL